MISVSSEFARGTVLRPFLKVNVVERRAVIIQSNARTTGETTPASHAPY